MAAEPADADSGGPGEDASAVPNAISSLRELLCLAATPAFAMMALLSGLRATPMERLCSPDAVMPLGGMAFMYAMMSLFHAPPWLKLLSRFAAL